MKITVQVSLSVYGSEEYLDGFSIISAGSHLPADIASAILQEAFLNFAWYSVLQITVPGFEFNIHVSNIHCTK